MPAIFAKTRKGQEEIEHRSEGLGPRARRLLILFDGKRPLDEVRAMMPDPKFDETVELLREGEFVEQVGGVSDAPAEASPEDLPEVSDTVVTNPAQLEKARNFMLNTLSTFNGPYCNIDLRTRINNSRSAPELRAMIGDWLESINLTKMGKLRAEELKVRLLEVL